MVCLIVVLQPLLEKETGWLLSVLMKLRLKSFLDVQDISTSCAQMITFPKKNNFDQITVNQADLKRICRDRYAVTAKRGLWAHAGLFAAFSFKKQSCHEVHFRFSVQIFFRIV